MVINLAAYRPPQKTHLNLQENRNGFLQEDITIARGGSKRTMVRRVISGEPRVIVVDRVCARTPCSGGNATSPHMVMVDQYRAFFFQNQRVISKISIPIKARYLYTYSIYLPRN